MSDDQKSLSSSMRNPVLVLALLCALSGLPAVLQAAPSVRVLALFPGKAMLEIEGRRKVLAAGESGPQGVRLISADTREAVVEIGGRPVRRQLLVAAEPVDQAVGPESGSRSPGKGSGGVSGPGTLRTQDG